MKNIINKKFIQRMNKIYTYLTKKLFIDIGTPKKYKEFLNLK